MAQWRLTRAAQKNLLLGGTKLIAGAIDGAFSACSLGLAKAAIAYDPDIVIGDITVADYTGYAHQAITWAAATHDGSDGRPSIAAAAVYTFQPGDGVTPNTIYGAFLIKTVGSAIQAVRNLDAPVQLVDASSLLKLLEELSFTLEWEFGNGVQLS